MNENKNQRDYKGSNHNKGNKRTASRYSGRDKGRTNTKSDSIRSGNNYNGGNGHISYDAVKSNDIALYNKDPLLFADATRVPFTTIQGVERDLFGAIPSITDKDYGSGGVGINSTMPGIIRVDYVPTIGVSEDYNSAPNRAFQSMYSAIYSKTTGAMQFPQYILGLHTICIQSIAQNIALLKRAIETSQLYSASNAYYPRTLLLAQGFKPSSIIGHQDELRMLINDIIKNFNSLSVPAYIDAFKRQYSLCHNVWIDQDDIQGQLIIFRPSMGYVYNGAGMLTDDMKFDGKAAALATTLPWATTEVGIDINDMIRFINRQIRMIRNSSDFGNILGAIKRAFPDSALLTIDPLTPDAIMVPFVDSTIADQLHNAMCAGKFDFPFESIQINSELANTFQTAGFNINKGLSITSDPVTNMLTSKPEMSANNYQLNGRWAQCGAGRILNSFDASQINPDWIMESTRLMYNVSTFTGGIEEGAHPFESVGTEIIEGYTIYNGDETYELTNGSIGNSFNYKGLLWLEKLHKAPRFIIYDDSMPGFLEVYGVSGDLNKWTVVDQESIAILNRTALLSIYSTEVPVQLK